MGREGIYRVYISVGDRLKERANGRADKGRRTKTGESRSVRGGGGPNKLGERNKNAGAFEMVGGVANKRLPKGVGVTKCINSPFVLAHDVPWT